MAILPCLDINTANGPRSSPLLELANYHVLGRVFHYVPSCAPLPPGRVLAIFGGLMILVEALNAIGVSLSANTSASPARQALGSNLTIAALALQFGVILSFVCLAVLFQRRSANAKLRSKAVNTVLATLYTSTSLILVRCIYRFVEHTGNTNVELGDLESLKTLSPIMRHEVFFYIFEASLMLINSVLWNVWNPGRFLPRAHHIYLAQDGTEVEGEQYEDNRSLFARLINFLTAGLLFREKNQTQRFQELTEYPGSSRQNDERLGVPDRSS